MKIRMPLLLLQTKDDSFERDSCAEEQPLDSYIAYFIINEGPCSKDILDFEFLY